MLPLSCCAHRAPLLFYFLGLVPTTYPNALAVARFPLCDSSLLLAFAFRNLGGFGQVRGLCPPASYLFLAVGLLVRSLFARLIVWQRSSFLLRHSDTRHLVLLSERASRHLCCCLWYCDRFQCVLLRCYCWSLPMWKLIYLFPLQKPLFSSAPQLLRILSLRCSRLVSAGLLFGLLFEDFARATY